MPGRGPWKVCSPGGVPTNPGEESTGIFKRVKCRKSRDGYSAAIVFGKERITAEVPGRYGRTTEPLMGITPQRFPFTLPSIWTVIPGGTCPGLWTIREKTASISFPGCSRFAGGIGGYISQNISCSFLSISWYSSKKHAGISKEYPFFLLNAPVICSPGPTGIPNRSSPGPGSSFFALRSG